MRRAVRAERLALAAATGVGIQVGAAMVATRVVVDEISPTSLALLRYVIGSLCIAIPLLAMRRWPRFARADILPIALLGIGQFAVLVVLLNFALRGISAARGSVIFASMPLITMVLGAALGREAMTAAKTLGVCLTIVGVASALGDKVLEGGGDAQWLGAAAAFGSALTGAVCSVFYRPYLRRYPTLEVSAAAMAASVIALLFATIAEGSLGRIADLTPRGWMATLFIGFSSGIGYVLWLWALGNASATRVTAFLSLSPIAASILGLALLGEKPTALLMFGLVAVVCGLWVAYRDPR